MNAFVDIAMFGWIPCVLALFALLPSRRAVITGFLVAWLFLPMAGYKIVGLPDYTKMSATCVGVLLGTVLFDIERLTRFRPAWLDVPMLVFCLCTIPTSIVNGLGAYDGFSACLHRTFEWGFPYFIGRLYFNDLEGLRELAIGVFIGGLIYMPLCLFEIRMSPQLHTWVYGFHQHSFAQSKRGGGWRPVVFMQHGLMVGMWMCAAAMIGFWLWRAGGLRRLGQWTMTYLVIALSVTAVLCKSTGAVVLMLIGIGTLEASRRMGRSFVLLALAACPVAYMVSRGSGAWDGRLLVDLAATISAERADSLETRRFSEDKLTERARQQPVFGWGGWGRFLIEGGRDEETYQKVIQDGFWVITFGSSGVIGLAAVTAAFLAPAIGVWRRWPPRLWRRPECAAVAALSVLIVLYTIDNIFNAMINPIFTLVAGALTSLAAGPAFHAVAAARGRVPRPRPATAAGARLHMRAPAR